MKCAEHSVSKSTKGSLAVLLGELWMFKLKIHVLLFQHLIRAVFSWL